MIAPLIAPLITSVASSVIGSIAAPNSAASAANAYARVQQGGGGDGVPDFSAVLGRAIQGTVDAGHAADTATVQALSGPANLTQVVTAVSRAELSLQTATAIRDRMVSAYQDIMRMPI